MKEDAALFMAIARGDVKVMVQHASDILSTKQESRFDWYALLVEAKRRGSKEAETLLSVLKQEINNSQEEVEKKKEKIEPLQPEEPDPVVHDIVVEPEPEHTYVHIERKKTEVGLKFHGEEVEVIRKLSSTDKDVSLIVPDYDYRENIVDIIEDLINCYTQSDDDRCIEVLDTIIWQNEVLWRSKVNVSRYGNALRRGLTKLTSYYEEKSQPFETKKAFNFLIDVSRDARLFVVLQQIVRLTEKELLSDKSKNFFDVKDSSYIELLQNCVKKIGSASIPNDMYQTAYDKAIIILSGYYMGQNNRFRALDFLRLGIDKSKDQYFRYQYALLLLQNDKTPNERDISTAINNLRQITSESQYFIKSRIQLALLYLGKNSFGFFQNISIRSSINEAVYTLESKKEKNEPFDSFDLFALIIKGDYIAKRGSSNEALDAYFYAIDFYNSLKGDPSVKIDESEISKLIETAGEKINKLRFLAEKRNIEEKIKEEQTPRYNSIWEKINLFN